MSAVTPRYTYTQRERHTMYRKKRKENTRENRRGK